jgi:hypothetical protein
MTEREHNRWVTLVLVCFAQFMVSYLAGLGHQPGPQDKAAGLVEGFQVAFTSAAILVTVGAILLALLLRSRDIANVNPERGLTVPA